MKNNKSVTAVEWVISELRESKDFHRVINELNQRSSAVRHILNEALQMEKEQIIDAHNYGFTEGTCFGASPIGYKFVESEQYYNETFKTKEK